MAIKEEIPTHGSFAGSTIDPSTQMVEILGHAAIGDGGGAEFRRVASEPAPLGLPAFHKAQDYGGNWWETTSRTVLRGEEAGLLGSASADVTGEFNEAMAWLGRKGGGRLILPSGVTRLGGEGVVDVDGVHVCGGALGHQDTAAGSILLLSRPEASHKLRFGTENSVRRYAIKFSDMQVLCNGGLGYAFQTYNIRNIYFDNISFNYCYGFLKVGSDNNPTVCLWINNIEGNLLAPEHLDFMNLENCSGTVFFTNSHVEGANAAGSAILRVPSWAYDRPDGMVLANNTLRTCDHGVYVSGGCANVGVSECLFDGMSVSGLFLEAAGAINGFTMTGGHLAGKPGVGQYGVFVNASAAAVNDVVINGVRIFDWQHNGAWLADGRRISLLNNTFKDVAQAADNTEAAIRVGANIKSFAANGNVISTSSGNRPRYGILDESTCDTMSIQNNTIITAATAAYSLQGSAASDSRVVLGNTGQG